MNRDQNDEALLKQVKATLDEAAQDLDPATETRLRVMRREAIAQAGKRQSPWAWQWGGAVAATVLVAALLLNLQDNNTGIRKIENVAGLEDLQMLSAAEDLEFYQNLEFYQELEFYNRLNEIQKTG